MGHAGAVVLVEPRRYRVALKRGTLGAWESIRPRSNRTTLVARDLIGTLGFPTETAEALARREAVATAEIMNEWDEDEVSWPLFLARVVEETQQWLHDTFIDTTWPRCPEHANHPLWLNDDESARWTCTATNTTVCPVGQLGGLVAVDDATAAMNIGRLEADSAQDAAMLARLDRGLRR